MSGYWADIRADSRQKVALMRDYSLKITDLERQLASALRCGIFCGAGCEKDKKLEAIREWYVSLGGRGDAMLPGLGAILGEKGA